MSGEPPIRPAVAFVDGQNLFHATREAFGYTYPNYDVAALAKQCARGRAGDWWGSASTPGSPMSATTPGGIPSGPASSRPWGGAAWSSTAGHSDTATAGCICPTARNTPLLTGEEKGIDVRIALAHRREYDVAPVFSQDQDRPSALRPVPRPAGLPREAPRHVGCLSGNDTRTVFPPPAVPCGRLRAGKIRSRAISRHLMAILPRFVDGGTRRDPRAGRVDRAFLYHFRRFPAVICVTSGPPDPLARHLRR